ncbi:MAG: hypothetical protein HOH58_17115 [Opitutaceae bacterium]|jgi:hypothetical protein|nr:hypothetical protein [Opitutaceae bacterium]
MAAPAAYRGWKHVLLWGGVLLLLMLRVPLLWQTGEFVSEDGWVFFAGAFNAPWYESLVTPFAGYFRLEARLFAELISPLPWGTQPYAYAMGGLSLNALVLSLFYLPGFRHLVASDGHRLAIVGLLALAPNAENLGLLTGMHWYLGFALTLILVIDPPSHWQGRVALVLGSSLCVWSSPSALVLFPVFVLRALKVTDPFLRRWTTAVVLQLVLCAVAVLVFRGTEGTRSDEFDRGVIYGAVEHLMVRGWFTVGLWGRGISEYLVNLSPRLVDLLGWVTMSVLAGMMWRTRHGREVGPILLVVAAGMMTTLSLTRTLYIGELAELDLPRHVRYLTTSTLILILVAWITIGRVLGDRSPKLWWMLVGIHAVVLSLGLSAERHWARPPGEFRFRDHIMAIENFREDYVETRRQGSLYLPNDVPYWGPVLESEDGQLHHPEDGLLVALILPENSDGWVDSWLGRFRILEDNKRLDHENWGRLTYTGTEMGRVWFVDDSGRQIFTSRLLYPRAWMVDGLDMQLIP